MIQFTHKPRISETLVVINHEARHNGNALAAKFTHLTPVARGWKVAQGPAKDRQTFATIEEAVSALSAQWEAHILSMPRYARLNAEVAA